MIRRIGVGSDIVAGLGTVGSGFGLQYTQDSAVVALTSRVKAESISQRPTGPTATTFSPEAYASALAKQIANVVMRSGIQMERGLDNQYESVVLYLLTPRSPNPYKSLFLCNDLLNIVPTASRERVRAITKQELHDIDPELSRLIGEKEGVPVSGEGILRHVLEEAGVRKGVPGVLEGGVPIAIILRGPRTKNIVGNDLASIVRGNIPTPFVTLLVKMGDRDSFNNARLVRSSLKSDSSSGLSLMDGEVGDNSAFHGETNLVALKLSPNDKELNQKALIALGTIRGGALFDASSGFVIIDPASKFNPVSVPEPLSFDLDDVIVAGA